MAKQKVALILTVVFLNVLPTFPTEFPRPPYLHDYFPALVGITSVPGQQCTGILVSPSWVMTARRCYFENALISVMNEACVTGDNQHCFSTSVDSKIFHTEFNVKSINYSHSFRMPDVTKPNLTLSCFDFALLHLKTKWPFPVKFAVRAKTFVRKGLDRVFSVCSLVTFGDGNSTEVLDTPLFRLGNRRVTTIPLIPEQLLCNQLEACHRTMCNYHYHNNAYGMYYQGGRGALHGDVGAPLFCYATLYGWQVWGISTGVYSNALARIGVGMFERVDYYSNLISETND